MLVIATPDTLNVRKVVEIARTLNPSIEVVVRTHNEAEAALLQQENIGTVFMGEHELALGMTRHVLMRRGVDVQGLLTGNPQICQTWRVFPPRVVACDLPRRTRVQLSD